MITHLVRCLKWHFWLRVEKDGCLALRRTHKHKNPLQELEIVSEHKGTAVRDPAETQIQCPTKKKIGLCCLEGKGWIGYISPIRMLRIFIQ